MQVLYPRCAGLDVHKDTVVACVRCVSPPVRLELIAALKRALGELDGAVGKALAPIQERARRLTTLPGPSDRVARVVVAKIGVDMARFPSPGHLISWAGPCPRNDEGAGKRRSTRVRRSGTWLKTTLVTAAWAAVRVKSGCLHGQPLRLKARRGAKKAILAGAASMLTAIYVMLRNRVPYRDLGPQHFDQRQRTRTIRRLLRRLHDLGCPVTISSSVPPSTVIASAP